MYQGHDIPTSQSNPLSVYGGFYVLPVNKLKTTLHSLASASVIAYCYYMKADGTTTNPFNLGYNGGNESTVSIDTTQTILVIYVDPTVPVGYAFKVWFT